LLLASLVINELLFGLKSNLKRRGIGGESKKFGFLLRHLIKLELGLRSLLLGLLPELQR
jgi:hypothetical protein